VPGTDERLDVLLADLLLDRLEDVADRPELA
jgi:hypothetical protein